MPNLAIHLNRGVNKEGLVLNEQRHMAPVLGLGKEPVLRAALARALEAPADAEQFKDEKGKYEKYFSDKPAAR